MSTFKTIICEQLEANGWQLLFNTSAIAVKTYDTLVGKRGAHIYFSEWDEDTTESAIDKEPNLSLSAEFITEGRNMLSASGELILKLSTPEEVAEQAKKFVVRVERDISNTLIVRLFDTTPAVVLDTLQSPVSAAHMSSLTMIPVTEADLRLLGRQHDAASYVSSASDDPEEIYMADQQLILIEKLFDAATVTIDEDDKFVQKEPEQSILANDDQGSPCF